MNISCTNLKKDEIAKIEFHSFGCFGSQYSELSLTDVAGITSADLSIDGKSPYRAIVTQQGIKSFYDFVDELKSVNTDGHCTTDQSCVVYSRNGTIKKKHIDCQWHGVDYLIGSLFPGQGIGKIVRYEEKKNDPTINFDFRIRKGNYDLYFSVPQITAWCEKMMKTKDNLEPMYKSIKQEVNHETADYLADNHSWIMALFTPRIINVKTKEEGKSFLVKNLDTLTGNRIYYVITLRNDTVRLFDNSD